MTVTNSARRAWRRALVAAIVAVAGAGALAGPAAASNAVSQAARGHGYRHGVVPLRPGKHHNGAFGSVQAAGTTGLLSYGGGVGGVGVTSGPERVYIVFWGSQWGTQSTNGQGYVTLSGDPNNAAPLLQAFFKGLGTGGETWSGVMTQYCEGIATGSTTCPSTAAHVGYPTGGALAGVWVDESSAAPASASGHQIGQEAVNAAAHFGNTTSASNRYVQYDIVSPTGTTPDGFNTAGGNFCAWHDYTGDSTLTGGAVNSPYGNIAFTNMPYVTDAGSGCGQNFVNAGAAGTDDGFTIVNGHEYAETITDQFPAGGWTDSSGAENGDKCAWISSGAGASQNITLTTGTFAVQSTWANDDGSAGGCEVSHAIVGGGGGPNTVTVTNPGAQTSTVGAPVSLQIQASDSASGQTLTYGASGLPAGLSINGSTGLISGTPTTAATSSVTVTATDGTGASGSTSFTWTVNPSSGGSCTPAQLLGDPGFESGGTNSPWTATSGVFNSAASEPPHSGSWDAWLDGYGTTHTDTLAQTVTIPSGCNTSTLSLWLHIDTAETGTVAHDTLTVQLLSSSGTVLTTLATYSNLNAATGYVQKSFNVGAYAGQAVTLKFTGAENNSLQTSFVIDDTALNTSGSGGTSNTVTVTNPGGQVGTVGTAASLQIQATDSASGQTLTYGATGLPAGLSINASTGLISGTPTTAGVSSVTVTATDTTGAKGTTAFSWTVNAATANTVTVTSPGNQTSTAGTAIAALQIQASDSASGQTLTYTATGLPAGLSISSSGLITGTPTTAGTSTVTVKATDTTGASGSTTFTWTVNAASGGCTAAQLLKNPGFESGPSQTAWTWTSTLSTAADLFNSSSSEPPHGGTYDAWLNGWGRTDTDTLAQSVSIPSTCKSATLTFWLHIDTAETTTTTAYDTLKVQILNSSGTVLSTLHTYSNLDHAAGYTQRSFGLTAYIGQAITLKFTGSEDASLQTSFVIDDTAVNVS